MDVKVQMPKKKEAAKKANEEKKEQATANAADDNGWSSAQQKQMEEGMKKFPASIPAKERWTKIAELVDDKTPKECFERFKEIVAKLKQQQGGK